MSGSVSLSIDFGTVGVRGAVFLPAQVADHDCVDDSESLTAFDNLFSWAPECVDACGAIRALSFGSGRKEEAACVLLPDNYGTRKSLRGYRDETQVVSGDKAKQMSNVKPYSAVYNLKRFFGQLYSEYASATGETDLSGWPFGVVPSPVIHSNVAHLSLCDVELYDHRVKGARSVREEVNPVSWVCDSRALVSKLLQLPFKTMQREYLHLPDEVFVSYPLHFTNVEREGLRQCVYNSAMACSRDRNVGDSSKPQDSMLYVHMIPDAVAALVALNPPVFTDEEKELNREFYERHVTHFSVGTRSSEHMTHSHDERRKLVLLVDVGASGASVAIAEIVCKTVSYPRLGPSAAYACREYRVLGSNGCKYLAGETMTDVIVAELRQRLCEARHEAGIEGQFADDARTWRRLRVAAENAKQRLAVMDTVLIEIISIEGVDLRCSFSRGELETLFEDFENLFCGFVREIMVSVKKQPAEFDSVFMIGGCSRMPMFRGSILRLGFDASQISGMSSFVQQDVTDARSSTVYHAENMLRVMDIHEYASIGGAVIAAYSTLPFVKVITSLPYNLGLISQGDSFATVCPIRSELPAERKCRISTKSDYQRNCLFAIADDRRRRQHPTTLLQHTMSTLPARWADEQDPQPEILCKMIIPGSPHSQIHLVLHVTENSLIKAVWTDRANGKTISAALDFSTLTSWEDYAFTDASSITVHSEEAASVLTHKPIVRRGSQHVPITASKRKPVERTAVPVPTQMDELKSEDDVRLLSAASQKYSVIQAQRSFAAVVEVSAGTPLWESEAVRFAREKSRSFPVFQTCTSVPSINLLKNMVKFGFDIPLWPFTSWRNSPMTDSSVAKGTDISPEEMRWDFYIQHEPEWKAEYDSARRFGGSSEVQRRLFMTQSSISDTVKSYSKRVAANRARVYKPFGGDAMVEIQSVYKRLSALEVDTGGRELCLDCMNVTALHMTVVSDYLKENLLPIALSLVGNQIAYPSIDVLCTGLVENYSLRSLSLEKNVLKDEGCGPLAQVLSVHPTLSHINLGNNLISDTGISMLCEGISKGSKQLQSLSLWGNRISDDGCAVLCDTLAQCVHLQYLNLSQNLMSSKGAKSLAQLMITSPVLAVVDVHFNNVGTPGAIAIAEAMMVNSSVLTLSLEKNDISDLGVRPLADMLRVNRKLVQLNVAHNKISDTGLEYFINALDQNSTLKDIVYWGNTVSADTAGKLVEKLSNRNAELTIAKSLMDDVVRERKSLATSKEQNRLNEERARKLAARSTSRAQFPPVSQKRAFEAAPKGKALAGPTKDDYVRISAMEHNSSSGLGTILPRELQSISSSMERCKHGANEGEGSHSGSNDARSETATVFIRKGDMSFQAPESESAPKRPDALASNSVKLSSSTSRKAPHESTVEGNTSASGHAEDAFQRDVERAFSSMSFR